MSDIKLLLREGRTLHREFIQEISDPRAFAFVFTGMQNAAGGIIFLGVKESGKIAGIHPEDELNKLQFALSLFSRPDAVYEHEIIQEGHKLVLLLKIDPSPVKIQFLNSEQQWVYPIRVGTQTLEANKIILSWWKLLQEGRVDSSVQGEDAETMLGYIAVQTEEFTLSSLYKHLDLPKKRIDYLLALFLFEKKINLGVKNDVFTFISL